MANEQATIRALRAALAEVVTHLTICPYCHRLKQGNVIKHESGCELAALLEEQ
jgi:hypothetical protein